MYVFFSHLIKFVVAEVQDQGVFREGGEGGETPAGAVHQHWGQAGHEHMGDRQNRNSHIKDADTDPATVNTIKLTIYLFPAKRRRRKNSCYLLSFFEVTGL